ncbi:hypothetical protein Q4E93_01210 [Flavitalea sp. BT771]|uniref:hypothetical protein n=1 Tax=Flavitalea sp. BT771 TaxID=3063329 RepID=UPI0026E24D46|nr:hypothetical protein [Flavitalea sp. BT771]MDO6429185.1 hypothetical protein [Flavitalea sp. BT771]MDV6218687.1 hypothetical protein [Flavitalea sp. BT771]
MRLLSLILILLSFSSCVSYQYLTLNSPEMPKNGKKDFSWENDTMRLTYNFHGEGGPVTMTVFNKTDKPLFVNWKKSALIRGGEAFSLLDHNVQISGGYTGSSAGGRVFQSASGSINGSFELPEGINLVPPGTFITKSLNAVVEPNPVHSDKFTAKPQPPSKMLTSPAGKAYTYRSFSFDQAASPFQFSSYLTFALANNTQEFYVSHSFYVQEVILSSEIPESFGLYKPEGDQLFVKVSTQ